MCVLYVQSVWQKLCYSKRLSRLHCTSLLLTLSCLLSPTTGITCFVNRQLIYNFPEQIFTEAGVISIEHADFDGTRLLWNCDY